MTQLEEFSKLEARTQHAIEVVEAHTHNLKGISCEVPHGTLTVVTGVSGSGKSSLAFDTLYAEGQRRYVASMSTYARQFLEKIQRPDVEAIHNIPPAIALEQKNTVTNARSTIGTATEIRDFLRLMFARVGHILCPDCGQEVETDSVTSAAQRLAKLEEGTRLIVIAPVMIDSTDAATIKGVLADMRAQGFARAMDEDGTLINLEEFNADHLIRRKPPARREEPQKKTKKRGRKKKPKSEQALFIDLVADRVVLRPDRQTRLAEALELAFRAGSGRARVRDADAGGEWVFSEELTCNGCGRLFRRPEPALFSFSSPLGACPECQGFGRVTGIDMEKVIPDWSRTLMDDPVVPWNSAGHREMYDFLKNAAPEIPWHTPLEDFNEEQRRVFLKGNRKEGGDWTGVEGFFKWLEGRKYKIQARVLLSRYRAYTKCPECEGARLVPDALAVKIDGHNIADICTRSIGELHEYFDLMRLPPNEEERVERLLTEIRSRLAYLNDVGLGYLTLARQTRTLSGGESQRINLATALGSALTETLYVLDEPTVGLHSRDTYRLLAILKALRERGNTVVVVEHDPDVILGADRIIDIGPAAGERGGQLLYSGDLGGLAKSDASITAKYLAEPTGRRLPSRERRPSGWITVRGARENNLKNLNVRIPRGVLCCVTGVSGSGKSTLVNMILHNGFRRMRDNVAIDVGDYDRLDGVDALEDILLVDQKPIGRSTRSNPVTYVKAYDEIRKLFANTREARHAGIKPGDFSFNIEGGRCETCQGAGIVTIDMHFLADVEVTCDDCDGKRFQRRILNIEWNGKNIDDVLDMTVDEARLFFGDEHKVLRGLEPLHLVGLGYLRLGQSTATLSGGEAQRLKLAGFLAQNKSVLRRLLERRGGQSLDARKPTEAETLMIFDEPTTGLHPADLDRLMSVLQSLVDAGISILVIEHNLDLVAQADYIIDLGPEGGDEGGEIVYEGPASGILKAKNSHTGRFLSGRYKA